MRVLIRGKKNSWICSLFLLLVPTISWGVTVSHLPMPADTRAVDVADVDGDGDVDIVGVTGDSLVRFVNNGFGVFAAQPTLYLSALCGQPGAYVPRIQFGHFDLDDTFPDLVIQSVAVFGDGAIMRLKGTGNGGFVCQQVYAGNMGGASDGLAVGDTNGDGRDEIFWIDDNGIDVARVRGLAWSSTSPSTLTVARTLQNGTRPCNQGPTSPRYRNLKMLETNLASKRVEGAMDLLAVSFNWRSVAVWEGKGNTTFYTAEQVRNQECVDSPEVAIDHNPWVGMPVQLSVGSFPFDSLLTLNNNDLVSTAFWNIGTDQYVRGHGYSFPALWSRAYDAILVDWDGNGRKDLIVGGGTFNVDGYVRLLTIDDEHYPPLISELATLSQSVGSLASADFNADGKPDLVIGAGAVNTITVLVQ